MDNISIIDNSSLHMFSNLKIRQQNDNIRTIYSQIYFCDRICNSLFVRLEIKDTKSSCWAESLTVSSTFINTQQIQYFLKVRHKAFRTTKIEFRFI